MEVASNNWIKRLKAMLFTNATSTVLNNVTSLSQCTVRGSKYLTGYWHGILEPPFHREKWRPVHCIVELCPIKNVEVVRYDILFQEFKIVT